MGKSDTPPPSCFFRLYCLQFPASTSGQPACCCRSLPSLHLWGDASSTVPSFGDMPTSCTCSPIQEFAHPLVYLRRSVLYFPVYLLMNLLSSMANILSCRRQSPRFNVVPLSFCFFDDLLFRDRRRACLFSSSNSWGVPRRNHCCLACPPLGGPPCLPCLRLCQHRTHQKPRLLMFPNKGHGRFPINAFPVWDGPCYPPFHSFRLL